MRWLLGLLIGILIGAGGYWYASRTDIGAIDPQTIADASLESVRAQNRLTVFAGRFTVAVTSRASKYGLEAEKTMIVPANVRYDIDYAKLEPGDIRWDPETQEMIVDLPDIEVSAPEIDLTSVREYEDGSILMALGNAEEVLDRANRRKVRDAVLKEAQSDLMLDLAREAGRVAAARSFRLPLEAADIPATVTVRYPGESGSGS